MSSFTINTVTPPPTPFELVSGQWKNFLGFKPFRDFERSQQTPGTRDVRLDFTLYHTTAALGNWLSRLRATLGQQGLRVSELVLVMWVLQCLEPGLRSFLERSLATEPEPEKVGFNTLKLHLEVWSGVLLGGGHRKHWNKVTKGRVGLAEFWAAQGAQKHSDLVRRWRVAWDLLSGEDDVRMTDAPLPW